jgi:tetratricopeptide (TPR) repeat protein
MVTTYNATIKAQMLASSTCESCGKNMWIETPINGAGSGYSPDVARQSAFTNLTRQLERIQTNHEYGYGKCPHCDYTQSWMRSSIDRATFSRMKWLGYGLLWLFGLGALVGVLVPLVDEFSSALNLGWQIVFAVLAVLSIALPLGIMAGIYFFMQRRYTNPQTALATYTPVVGFGVNAPAAHATVGITYANQNDLPRAFIHFDEALKKEPNNALALGGRGFAHFKKGNMKEAEQDLRRHVHLLGKGANPQFASMLTVITAMNTAKPAAGTANPSSPSTPPAGSQN